METTVFLSFLSEKEREGGNLIWSSDKPILQNTKIDLATL